MPSAKLRKLDTTKSLTPAELEIINKNWFDIEAALSSVGGITPGSSEFPPDGTFLKFGPKGPMFAATPLGIETLPEHGAEKHDDRIRRVLLPVGAWRGTKALLGTDPNSTEYISFTNGVQVYSQYLFQVPADFASEAKLGVLAAESANDGNDFDLELYTKKLPLSVTDITAAYDNLDSFVLVPNGINKIGLALVDISTPVVADDVLRLTLTRLTTDPNATNMLFFGAYFEYTADM